MNLSNVSRDLHNEDALIMIEVVNEISSIRKLIDVQRLH